MGTPGTSLDRAPNIAMRDSSGPSARNGKALTNYFETHPLYVKDQIELMAKTGIERSFAVAHHDEIAIDSRPGGGSPGRARHQRPISRVVPGQVPDRLLMFARLPEPRCRGGRWITQTAWGHEVLAAIECPGPNR